MTFTKPSPARPRPFSYFAIIGALILTLTLTDVLGQEETRGGSRDTETTGLFVDRQLDTNNVLIVPFENRMYRSVADPGTVQMSGSNVDVIRATYRSALVEKILNELQRSGSMPQGQVVSDEYQERVYKGLGYQSEKVQWPEEERKGIKKLTPKKKRTGSAERTGTYIENGQIRTIRDTSTKVMVPVILDPALQPWLQEQFGTGRTLFITQFDIVPRYGMQYAGFGLDTATCTVQVHCSVFEDRQKLKTRLIRRHYKPCFSDQQELIERTFDPIAREIAEMFIKKEEE